MLTKYKLKFPTFIAKNHLWSATFVILRIRRGNIGDRISVKNWRSLPRSLLKLKDYFKPIRRLIRYSISTRTNIKIKFAQEFEFLCLKKWPEIIQSKLYLHQGSTHRSVELVRLWQKKSLATARTKGSVNPWFTWYPI